MKHGNMNWLVWKEYRQNRLTVWAMLFFLALPYLLCLILACVAWARGWEKDQGSPYWLTGLHAASYLSIYIPQFALALIGGNLIAGERVDRSAEFQACLPVSRRRILLGKILLALLMFAIIWVPNIAVFFGTWYRPWWRWQDPYDLEIMLRVAIAGLTFFCGRGLSRRLGSPGRSPCAQDWSAVPGMVADLARHVAAWL